MKKSLFLILALVLFSCSFVRVHQSVNVPGDYATLQDAIDALPYGGTIMLQSGTYYGLRSYGTSRTASIVIDGNRNIEIFGDGNPVITYDPANPPTYYGEWGPILINSNAGETIINGVHFVGTRSLGDPLYDMDVCFYSISNAPFIISNSEFSECGHAGVKHGNVPSHPRIIFENSYCHDIGFTSRDHCIYFPGGGDYVIRNNQALDVTGGCVGIGNGYWTDGGIIQGNICVNNGYGVWSGWGQGETIQNNFAYGSTYYDLGIFGGGHTFDDNTTFTIYSERSCGAIVTNWCADPVPNVFYDNGNIYETISHPDRIE